MPIHILSTKELQRGLEDRSVVLIDVRQGEAYNGWKVLNETRGGHIRGARSLPGRWRKYIDWIEIVRAKGIFPEQAIVLYGYDEKQIIPVADRFFCAGYGRVMMYKDFLKEWNPDDHLPMDRLPRYRQLVSARWLHDLISHKAAPELENKNFVIAHAHYQNQKDYDEGHIPGALSLDTLLLESPEMWNRRSPEELQQVLQDLGITCSTTVILYGRFSFPDDRDPFPGSSAGQLAAMRCAFIMMYAGVEDVRILNGGILSWEEEGFSVSKSETRPTPVLDFGAKIPSHPEYAVDLPEAREILASSRADLICVRSRDEYLGEISGYNYIQRKGRIPGAIFSNCGSDAYHMEEYRNLDHTCREYHEIEANWRMAGIDTTKRLAGYCGTGWRGSEAFFNAYLMGVPDIAVYDGGWLEWSSDPQNPIETGFPVNTKHQQNIITNANPYS
ncbi:MAG: rhodanese-like domain-containing protein [Syntrophothermus sp.]